MTTPAPGAAPAPLPRLAPLLVATVLPITLPCPARGGDPPVPLPGVLARGASLAAGQDPVPLDVQLRRFPEGFASRQGVVVVAEGVDGVSLARAVARAGGRVQARSGAAVQAFLPWSSLESLAGDPAVRRVRTPLLAHPSGDVTSEGVESMGADGWARAGLDGEGIEIAVIDVGFEGWEDLAGIEVPEDAPLVGRGPYTETESHGTGVAEIVYDLAPAASYRRYTFATDLEFLQLADELADDPPDVVTTSVGFPNYFPANGESAPALAVDALTSLGALFVVATGNEAQKYRIGVFGDADEDGRLEWEEGGPERLKAYLVEGGLAHVVVRWDDPFGAVRNDFDVQLATVEGDVLAESQDDNVASGVPFEDVFLQTDEDAVWVTIRAVDAPDLGAIEVSAWSLGGFSEFTPGGLVTVPADARGALAVGAVHVGEESVAYYSSRGPTEDGRSKPEVCAPSAVSTATYGTGAFTGTSAAAPHAAGLAALLWQALGVGATAGDVREGLLLEVADIGADPNECGAGLLEVGEPPAAWACRGCAAADTRPGPGAAVWAGTAGLALAARRRCGR